MNLARSKWFFARTVIAVIIAGAGLFTGSPIAAPIPVTTVTKDATGVTFAMTPGSMRIDVCMDGIIRVRYSTQNTIPVDNNMSFLIAKTWPTSSSFTQTETATDVTITTSKVGIKVNKSSGAVTFLDAAGTTVLQETATGGKTITPATVNGESTNTCEQIWDSPADEGIYGLGSMHDGFINLHGMPEYLRQFNTHICIPMIISSKGYGILWANSSNTYFNRPDNFLQLTNGSGTMTTTTAGDYVFLLYDAGLSGTNSITVGGKQLNSLSGTWHSSTLSGITTLAANSSVNVSNAGGGFLYGGPLHNATKFTSRSGQTIDYYFFYGPAPDSVIAGYRLATGAASLLPKGTYGFIHCKAQYNNQTEIQDAASQFRSRKIPIDVIVQDWNYWAGGWNSMVFNSGYSNPKQMITTIHGQNLSYMISVWSKTDGGSAVDNALTPYKLPGTPFFDAFNPQARSTYWSNMNNNLFSLGVDAFWQDADEPEGQNMEAEKVNFGSGAVGGKQYANAYPMFVCKTVYEGWRSTTSTKRVCLLTRSAFAGTQRFGTMCWNGDIGSNWDWFGRSVRAGLNFGMAGMPYWTTDIGGFFRPSNDQTDAGFNELLSRWIEYGSFCPIFRIHGYNTHTEIWNYSATTQATFLMYDNLRYRLLPYTYSLAGKVNNSGYTMMRGLVMDFPNDAKALNIGDQFMFGPAILVNPIMSAGATSRSVYLPDGSSWVDFWSGQSSPGGQTVTARAPRDTMPLFVKAGSIIPMGPYVQYAAEKKADTIELRVYPGADGSFSLYEDEGDNYNYETGKYSTIPITYLDKSKNVVIGARSGSFTGMDATKVFKVFFVSAGKGTGVSVAGTADNVLTYTGVQVSITPVGIAAERSAAGHAMPADITVRTVGKMIRLPEGFSGKTKVVQVFDSFGRLLQKSVLKKNVVDVQKDFGLAGGAYIVKIGAIR